MAEILGLSLICLCGVLAVTFFVHYFWQISFKAAFKWASFFIGMFLLFWVSRLWENSSRHGWGVLTPIFMLIILASWLLIKFGPALIKKIKHLAESHNQHKNL